MVTGTGEATVYCQLHHLAASLTVHRDLPSSAKPGHHHLAGAPPLAARWTSCNYSGGHPLTTPLTVDDSATEHCHNSVPSPSILQHVVNPHIFLLIYEIATKKPRFWVKIISLTILFCCIGLISCKRDASIGRQRCILRLPHHLLFPTFLTWARDSHPTIQLFTSVIP